MDVPRSPSSPEPPAFHGSFHPAAADAGPAPGGATPAWPGDAAEAMMTAALHLARTGVWLKETEEKVARSSPVRLKIRAARLGIVDAFGDGSGAEAAFRAAERLNPARVIDHLRRAAVVVEMAANALAAPADARDARRRAEALRQDADRLKPAMRPSSMAEARR